MAHELAATEIGRQLRDAADKNGTVPDEERQRILSEVSRKDLKVLTRYDLCGVEAVLDLVEHFEVDGAVQKATDKELLGSPARRRALMELKAQAFDAD